MAKRTDHSTALLTTISTNLKRHRTRQGHSLERLAKLAGVSRAMLSQIETGKSVPTISLLLKVADALGVPIANLLVTPASRITVVLPKNRAKIVSASNGRFTSRALFPVDGNRRAEFYEVRIAGQHREQADPQAAGHEREYPRRRRPHRAGRRQRAAGRSCPKATRSSSTPTCRTAIATSMSRKRWCTLC